MKLRLTRLLQIKAHRTAHLQSFRRRRFLLTSGERMERHCGKPSLSRRRDRR
jgi:hypothetical protein